jgi:hypothetical protein
MKLGTLHGAHELWSIPFSIIMFSVCTRAALLQDDLLLAIVYAEGNQDDDLGH